MSVCHCFFFIDAMGAAVTRDQAVIRDLADHWKPLTSVFGYSSACVPSIMSGRWPEEHNHWSYFTHGGANPALRIPKDGALATPGPARPRPCASLVLVQRSPPQ